MSQGFVYAIQSGALVKIGFSAKPRLRLTKINSDASGPCRLLGYVAATKAQEAQLHGLLAPHRAYGEWFSREGLVEHFLSKLPFPEKTVQRRKRSSTAADHPIYKYREALGLSLRALSGLCGITSSELSRFENGKRPPSPAMAKRIVVATGGIVSQHQLRPDIWPAQAAE
jgi:DNA-binding transcriptional regulator YiaG